MKEVYSHYDSSIVGLLNGILNESKIPTILKNWTGSNIIEIPIPCLYPSIHVLNDSDAHEAKQIIQDYLDSEPEVQPDWECSNCGAGVDGFLSECWKCQSSKRIPHN
ncbi:MAG: DUF2007 domain-containing protein [Verrucomicrobiota bacterium]